MSNTTNNDDLYASDTIPDSETVTIAFRVPKELRTKFNELCESRNVEVSKVLRRFIEREIKAAQQS
jgi:hypothetical protein